MPATGGKYGYKYGENVDQWMDELLEIGGSAGFIWPSSTAQLPREAYSGEHMSHPRAREIGKCLHVVAGVDLMTMARAIVRQRLGEEHAIHLSFAWRDIGEWRA